MRYKVVEARGDGGEKWWKQGGMEVKDGGDEVVARSSSNFEQTR